MHSYQFKQPKRCQKPPKYVISWFCLQVVNGDFFLGWIYPLVKWSPRPPLRPGVYQFFERTRQTPLFISGTPTAPSPYGLLTSLNHWWNSFLTTTLCALWISIRVDDIWPQLDVIGELRYGICASIRRCMRLKWCRRRYHWPSHRRGFLLRVCRGACRCFRGLERDRWRNCICSILWRMECRKWSFARMKMSWDVAIGENSKQIQHNSRIHLVHFLV